MTDNDAQPDYLAHRLPPHRRTPPPRNEHPMTRADHIDINNPELDQVPAAYLDLLILNAASNHQLSYLRPSDEWMITDDYGTAVLPDFLQDRAHRLVEAGLLPEFQDVTR